MPVLHSEVATLDRVKILRDLRRGDIDVANRGQSAAGGLDLPEVSLVAILDADKEGFLRSAGSLIQTMGGRRGTCTARRALRDVMTDSIAPKPSGRPTGGAESRCQYNERETISHRKPS